MEPTDQTASNSAAALSRRKRLPAASEALIRAEQVRLLHGSPFVWMFNLVVALLASWLLWHVYPPSVVYGWLGLLAIVIGVRLVMWIAFTRREPGDGNTGRWARIFSLGTFATGCIWGLLAATVFATDQPAYYVFVAFVLGGMTAGAALRDSAYLPAFYAFTVPATAPTIAALLVRDTPLASEMAFMLMAFTAVLILAGRSNAERIADNIRLQNEQDVLIGDLERMSADLKQRVSEREEAAAALKDAQRLAHIGSWVWHLKSDKVEWSEELYRIMQLNPAMPPPRAATVPQLPQSVAGERMSNLQAMMVACRTNGKPFAADLALPRASGGAVWISVQGEAVRDDDGTIMAVRGTVQDITQRKNAEAALRESEAALRDAQRLAHIGSWTWQLGNDDIQWSNQLYRTLGLDPSGPPLRAPDLPRIMKPAYAAQLQSMMTRCAQDGEPFQTDVEMTRSDGQTVWVAVRGEGVRDNGGAVTALRGTVQDITERKTAEAALQDKETTLREAQRLAHIGSWERPVHGTGSHWSEEIYRMFGIAPGVDAPSLDTLDRYLEPEALPRLRSALLACLRDGSAFTVDLKAVHSHGRKFWVSVHGEAVRDESGAITRLRGTVQDITERKTAEQNIATLHQQMAEQVKRLERHDAQMRTIARMSDLLQSCHSRGEAFPIVAATARTLFPDASGAIALVTQGSRQLETMTQWGDHPRMTQRFSFDDCWALRTGRRYDLAAPDQGALCHHFETAPDGPSLCLPLTVQGETSGLLHIDCPAGCLPDEEMQTLMTSFADVIKLSLANLRMREILSEQALRDQLTGLFNRHYLAETLPREIRRAERDHVPLSIAMLDLDHFKQLNDHFGHDAGDAVLRAVGKILKGTMRGGDIACRYGGEEFLLVLPECDVNDARALIEQIRKQIGALSLTLRETTLPAVTISAGVAEMDGGRASSDALIAAADQALYAAKRNGRDRLETFAPHSPEPRSLQQA